MAVRGGAIQGCGCFPTGGPWPGLVRSALGPTTALLRGVDPEVAWDTLAIVVVDVETTGLDARTDRVVELGVARIEGGRVVAREGWLVQPGIAVPEQALAVHGLTDGALRDAPPFADLIPTLRTHLEGALPAAYNAEFDRLFLREEFRRAGAPMPEALEGELEWLDPLVWVRHLRRDGPGYKLTEVAARMNIALEQAHRAAGDAEAAARILLALAPEMPPRYVEMIRRQRELAQEQDQEKAAARLSRSSFWS